MPKTEFKDLGFQFSIEIVKNIPIELKNEFKTVLSVIDKELINYYFELKKDPKSIILSALKVTKLVTLHYL